MRRSLIMRDRALLIAFRREKARQIDMRVRVIRVQLQRPVKQRGPFAAGGDHCEIVQSADFLGIGLKREPISLFRLFEAAGLMAPQALLEGPRGAARANGWSGRISLVHGSARKIHGLHRYFGNVSPVCDSARDRDALTRRAGFHGVPQRRG